MCTVWARGHLALATPLKSTEGRPAACLKVSLSEGYGDARQGSVECPGLSAGCQAYRGPPGERGRDEMARAGPGRSGSSGELRQVQGAWAWLSKGGGRGQ